MKLSDAQWRVLNFCARTCEGRFVSTREIEAVRILENDDVVTVPSLIEAGYLKWWGSTEAVRITEAGRAALNESEGGES